MVAFRSCNITTLQLTLPSLSLWRNVGSSAEDIIRRLKGNTGGCRKALLRSCPRNCNPLLLLAINATDFVTGIGKAPSNVESQETCRHHPQFIRAFG